MYQPPEKRRVKNWRVRSAQPRAPAGVGHPLPRAFRPATTPGQAMGSQPSPAPMWVAMWVAGLEADFASAIKHVRRMREPPTLARYRALAVPSAAAPQGRSVAVSVLRQRL